MRLLLVLALCFVSCSASVPTQNNSAPSFMLGEFEDDYGIRYTVTGNEWRQQPNAVYHIVGWRTEDQFFIAQNDSANATDGGQWTRIDWMPLSDMPPYEWAFCMSAYDKPTADAAEEMDMAERETPMTGCDGYPFSRMKRVELDEK